MEKPSLPPSAVCHRHRLPPLSLTKNSEFLFLSNDSKDSTFQVKFKLGVQVFCSFWVSTLKFVTFFLKLIAFNFSGLARHMLRIRLLYIYFFRIELVWLDWSALTYTELNCAKLEIWSDYPFILNWIDWIGVRPVWGIIFVKFLIFASFH